MNNTNANNTKSRNNHSNTNDLNPLNPTDISIRACRLGFPVFGCTIWVVPK